jgi:hypothetical protein
MHHLNPLYGGLASLLLLVAVFATLATMGDDHDRRGLSWRNKLVARSRAHPKLMTVWSLCVAGAFALLLAALLTWLA